MKSIMRKFKKKRKELIKNEEEEIEEEIEEPEEPEKPEEVITTAKLKFLGDILPPFKYSSSR